MISPCKDCESRTATCHDDCKAYKVYAATMEERRRKRQEAKEQRQIVEIYITDRMTRTIRRRNK